MLAEHGRKGLAPNIAGSRNAPEPPCTGTNPHSRPRLAPRAPAPGAWFRWGCGGGGGEGRWGVEQALQIAPIIHVGAMAEEEELEAGTWSSFCSSGANWRGGGTTRTRDRARGGKGGGGGGGGGRDSSQPSSCTHSTAAAAHAAHPMSLLTANGRGLAEKAEVEKKREGPSPHHRHNSLPPRDGRERRGGARARGRRGGPPRRRASPSPEPRIVGPVYFGKH